MSALPWCARDLEALVHPITPGRVYSVLSATGTGKTLMSLNAIATVLDREPTARVVVAATEEADRYTDLLACRAVGVSARDWFYGRLDDVHRQAVAEQQARYHAEERLLVLSSRRPTLAQLVQAVGAHHAHLVVVDHVHELDDQGERLPDFLGRAMAVLGEMATGLGVAVLAFAQVHRPPGKHDRLYAYRVPSLASAMGSSRIEQASDVVLGLSRVLRDDAPADALRRLARGLPNRGESERDYEDPDVARVTCLKHRLDDEARNRSVLLSVQRGTLRDRLMVVGGAPVWAGDAWEGDP